MGLHLKFAFEIYKIEISFSVPMTELNKKHLVITLFNGLYNLINNFAIFVYIFHSLKSVRLKQVHHHIMN